MCWRWTMRGSQYWQASRRCWSPELEAHLGCESFRESAWRALTSLIYELALQELRLLASWDSFFSKADDICMSVRVKWPLLSSKEYKVITYTENMPCRPHHRAMVLIPQIANFWLPGKEQECGQKLVQHGKQQIMVLGTMLPAHRESFMSTPK
jgi:hypothetical protein